MHQYVASGKLIFRLSLLLLNGRRLNVGTNVGYGLITCNSLILFITIQILPAFVHQHQQENVFVALCRY